MRRNLTPTDVIGKSVSEIMPFGPTRIVVGEDGHALPPGAAFAQYSIACDVVFVRNDGWSLGAPEYLESVARGMWPREWVGMARYPNMTITAVSSANNLRWKDGN